MLVVSHLVGHLEYSKMLSLVGSKAVSNYNNQQRKKCYHQIGLFVPYIYNLARRLRTIISEQNTLEIRLNELKSFLLTQKYPKKLVQSGKDRAMQLDQKTLRNVTEKTSEPVITYVSTHNPKNPEIFILINFNLPILQEDPKMNKVLSNFKLIKSKRQPNNLKRLLTKAKFNHDFNHDVKRCNRPNCGLYIHLLESNSFEFKCGKRFFVHESMTCEVKNVVYVLWG